MINDLKLILISTERKYFFHAEMKKEVDRSTS